MNKKSINGGFSLIEVAIVITIASLLLIPALKLFQTYMNQSKVAANQQRIAAIQQGLTNFATRYGKLPCPSSLIAQPKDADYGLEVAPLCRDKNDKPYIPDGKATFAATGRIAAGQKSDIDSAIIIGAVPVRNLGLPDSMRADVFGNLFTYAVTVSHTQSQSGDGVIDVVDENNRTVLPYADDKSVGTASYVLISHGRDGKGAYTASPTTAVRPTIPCDSAPGLDTLNCSFEATFPPSPFAFRTALYGAQRGPSWFDDIIAYHTPMSAVLSPAVTMTPPVELEKKDGSPANIPACKGQATSACIEQINDAMQKGEQIDEKQFNSIMQEQMKTLMQQSGEMQGIQKQLDQMEQHGR